LTNPTTVTANELYSQVATAFVADPSLEQALLTDFDATVAQRFGVALPKAGALERTADGFRLTYDGQHYDIGDPRTAAKGELNDAELELVSAGGNGCPSSDTPSHSSPHEGNLPSIPMPTLPPL
jgi:hypothetical protein